MIKKLPIPTEFEEQCKTIKWARMATLFDSRLNLLHGDSSGVRVPIGCAVKMKRAGAIKGWPDLFLAAPIISWNGNEQVEYHGLFLELKRRKGGKVDPEQAEIHRLLREQGYRVEVCHGSDQAIKVIMDYLGSQNIGIGPLQGTSEKEII